MATGTVEGFGDLIVSSGPVSAQRSFEPWEESAIADLNMAIRLITEQKHGGALRRIMDCAREIAGAKDMNIPY